MKAYPVVLTALLLTVPDARACTVAPADQRVPVAELLQRTSVIVLAEAIEEKRHNAFKATYTLKVVEPIRGASAPTIQIIGYPSTDTLPETTYANHTDAAFWNDPWIGRAPMSTDCRLYPPFTLGRMYLVFVDPPYHVKSFERIEDAAKDRWLQHVRENANPP